MRLFFLNKIHYQELIWEKISRSDSVKLYLKKISSKVSENETVSKMKIMLSFHKKISELVDTNDVLDFHNKKSDCNGL